MFNIHSNVVGGFILSEPATDLAVAIALASSMADKSVRNDVAFVGEIGVTKIPTFWPALYCLRPNQLESASPKTFKLLWRTQQALTFFSLEKLCGKSWMLGCVPRNGSV